MAFNRPSSCPAARPGLPTFRNHEPISSFTVNTTSARPTAGPAPAVRNYEPLISFSDDEFAEDEYEDDEYEDDEYEDDEMGGGVLLSTLDMPYVRPGTRSGGRSFVLPIRRTTSLIRNDSLPRIPGASPIEEKKKKGKKTKQEEKVLDIDKADEYATWAKTFGDAPSGRPSCRICETAREH